MITAIHQPNYIPWAGYFYKIAKSDLFVILDNVQFNSRGLTHKNKIKTPQGEMWVILPVHSEGNINEIKLKNNQNWKEKHLIYLKYNYKKAKYFDRYIENLEKIYNTQWEYMHELNIELIKFILKELNIETYITIASELKCEGKSTELLISICKEVGSDAYLSGMGGKNYMDETRFEQEGIKLVYSQFEHPIYEQLWGEFIPNLSVLDLLFNCGPKSIDYILSGEYHE